MFIFLISMDPKFKKRKFLGIWKKCCAIIHATIQHSRYIPSHNLISQTRKPKCIPHNLKILKNYPNSIKIWINIIHTFLTRSWMHKLYSIIFSRQQRKMKNFQTFPLSPHSQEKNLGYNKVFRLRKTLFIKVFFFIHLGVYFYCTCSILV